MNLPESTTSLTGGDPSEISSRALVELENSQLTANGKAFEDMHKKLIILMFSYRIRAALRWKPPNHEHEAKAGWGPYLQGEGYIILQSAYAVIGAVALEHGGQVAAALIDEWNTGATRHAEETQARESAKKSGATNWEKTVTDGTEKYS